MRIAVCVKHVPDGRLHIDPGAPGIDRTGPGDLNGVDRNAVEEALRLAADGAGEVVAVSMGPQQASESLRTVLGMGADRAVLVSDPAAVGSDLVATAKVLAKALEREEPDVVFLGQQTRDGGGAVLWAALAELLHMPFVSQAASLTLDGSTVRVTRQTESGDEVLEVTLPAVVAVSDAINEPRYTSLKGMMAAKRKPLDVLTLSDLGIDAAQAGVAGSRTSVSGIGPPPSRDVTKIEDHDGDSAPAIVAFLAERQLL
jgi:electron transfer flavoprotein beta subunit